MGFSALLRRLSSINLRLNSRPIRSPLLPSPSKPFSSLQSTAIPSDSPAAKTSSLSSRLSFVFDQIDAIEKERSQKDETLQRIRAWREAKAAREKAGTLAVPQVERGRGDADVSVEPKHTEDSSMKGEKDSKGLAGRLEVALAHPWPEWIELMERLVQQNYFDHRRRDEDKMIEDSGFKVSEAVEEGFDFTRDWKTVQTAVLNFGRDRFDILKPLSRQDIQILVGYGCPSADKKVVFSAKLLRKHVHLDEGDVCSSCSLRNSCEKAFLLTNKEDEARAIDVMRVLLTYGFDSVNGSVTNKSLLNNKSVKTVVRKLLHEVVRLSAVPIDPNLPPPVIKKPPPKVKQPPPTPKKRVGRDDIEMKKGDWICPKCDFMNFAKNTICLQCDAKRAKRQLLPGEWECPQCNFLNYRRNVVCFHCEHKRPPDEFTENQMRERHQGLRTRPEKITNRADISSAWNFDFDDDESDGADVAAFEYADSQKLDEDFPLDRNNGGERRLPRLHERDSQGHDPKKSGTGFDDFDDEDDIDGYELETSNSNNVREESPIDFSELEVDSEFADTEDARNNWSARRSTASAYSKPTKSMHRKGAYSATEDDELELDRVQGPVRSKRNSGQVAGFRPGRGRQMSDEVAKFRRRRGGRQVSDDDLGLSSDSEDSGSWKKNKSYHRDKGGFESDDDDYRGSRGNRSRRGSSGRGGRIEGNRGNSFGNKKQGFRSNERGFKVNNGGKERGRASNAFDYKSDNYSDDDRYKRRRVNVR